MVSESGEDGLLPVTLLCGFLGAGKTTLMKHILETKHAAEDFKCAVIVNDMAALNIDKSLIDQSAVVQSDEVIAMQNGCFCCTLQSDLVDQIVQLTQKRLFNYMLIEASGVSEPAQIAPLFELCDDDHDHEEEHTGGPQLGEVARLDTCVTVIDAADFHRNLLSMDMYEEGETKGTISELLMEQVEFSNVVVLNKMDLVDDQQQADVREKVAALNPKAQVLTSTFSKVDVMQLLDTKLYDQSAMEENSVMIAATKVDSEQFKANNLPSCCIESEESGKSRCCAEEQARNGQLIDSGKSEVLLGVVEASIGKKLTRHEQRFGISSFIYRARRPFHPGLLFELVMEPFFCLRYKEPELEGEEIPLAERLRTEADMKQKARSRVMGEVLRSKGFLWLATSHDLMGGWQTAGNILRVEAENEWMCLMRDAWEGSEAEELIKKDMTSSTGEEYQYGDRRQELVFIGVGLKHQDIQQLLDQCLLTDEEMVMGPQVWKQMMADEDRIQLELEFDDDDYEEGDEEDENEEDN